MKAIIYSADLNTFDPTHLNKLDSGCIMTIVL